MGVRCTLCGRWMDDRDEEVHCECGWVMDERCNGRHHEWCPSHGADGWIGAVEL